MGIETRPRYESRGNVARARLSDYLPPGMIETRETDVSRPSGAPTDPIEFQRWVTRHIFSSVRRD